jgi:hypothetical protein
VDRATLCLAMAGMVAGMTESDPGVVSEKALYTILG